MFTKNLLISNFLTDGLRHIAFLLDHIVYLFAKIVYLAFYELSKATLVDTKMIGEITTRIYAILGIAMIFVLAFNLLNYIIDPDKINDKKMGATSLIKDVVIALVILSMLPVAFTKIYSLQNQILSQIY